MKQILFFYSFIFFISCKPVDDPLFEIDPRTFIENNITLSDIADDIRYIPLYNSFPFRCFKYVINYSSIYVATSDSGILKFDRSGGYINKIGKKGRGPGEYLFGGLFTVDDNTGTLYVIDHTHITKVYSQDGTFLRKFDLHVTGEESGWGSDIEMHNGLLFYPNSLGQGESRYNWVFLDTTGQMITFKKNSLPTFQTITGRNAFIYRFNEKLFYYNYFNDTVFSISSEIDYKPVYIFAPGSHRWPNTTIIYKSISDLNSQLIKLFQPSNMFETKHFIVLGYGYQGKFGICFIEKETKKTYIALKYEKLPQSVGVSTPSIINDIDGGLPINSPKYYVEDDDEYLTTLLDPYKLKTHVQSVEFISINPKYPEKKKELEQLANSLKETDNPVLVMVRLKK